MAITVGVVESLSFLLTTWGNRLIVLAAWLDSGVLGRMYSKSHGSDDMIKAIQKDTKRVRLTAKQERFCREYLVDLNATQAAIRAGYSQKTAYSIGEENLKKPEIKKFISKQLEPEGDKLHEDAIKARNQLRKIVHKIDLDDPSGPQMKAIELTYRFYGLLVDKSEQRTTQDVQINLVVRESTRQKWDEGVEEMLGGFSRA